MIVFSILFAKHFKAYRFVSQTPRSIRKSHTGSNSQKTFDDNVGDIFEDENDFDDGEY